MKRLPQQRLRARPELRHAADPALWVLCLADHEVVHLWMREDEEEVLLEVGYTWDDITSLSTDRVI